MPTVPPFPSQQTTTAQPINNSLYPALYLYPLNDTWAPKHITVTNQHTKIGRQTSSKTAPGERNGFFDSKVLSRQHAEVWEENGKIYIKDVRSSNGTFINGERLSSEGQESEPFELKSDDIVEFGIDIVGEDNKTIIHHKVAARVVCVFNEQDAQVAARAEQHQQQQQQQQQQFLQQQTTSGTSSLTNVGNNASGSSIIGGSAGGPQNFPFAAAQRRAQLAQQGLGGMGGMRQPGKTGLSVDVILSRLQGELQKSRETGAELNSLNGAMNDIHDTFGGNLPSNVPPLPSTLPPVRPPPEPPVAPPHTETSAAIHGSSSPSPDHMDSQVIANVSGSVQTLQSQLRDTQSSLALQLDKVRALEGVLAEQEVIKHEVRSLKEIMEERRREMEMERAQVEERIRREVEQVRRGRSFERRDSEHGRREGLGPRGCFDVEDEEVGFHNVLDDEDETRSIATVIPHELEPVDEEDEDQFISEQETQIDGPESVQPLEDRPGGIVLHSSTSATDESHGNGNEEEEERRKEDLNVGRPRTPEPGLSLFASVRRHSLSSPLSQSFPSEPRENQRDDIYEQVVRLSKQLTSVMQVTKALEDQHNDARDTIKGLENKVASLEQLLKVAEEALATAASSPKKEEVAEPTVEPQESSAVLEETHYTSLVDIMADWKKGVEGQWTSVQEEWTEERERLAKARDQFESKLRQVDSGLEKMASLQTTLMSQQQQMQVQFQQQQQQLSALNNSSHVLTHPFLHHNGDAIKHYGGLVTPPSPRSQSSDSRRYRRRRRRSSGSSGGRPRSPSGGRTSSEGVNVHHEDEVEEDADTDATLASSTEDDLNSKAQEPAFGESTSDASMLVVSQGTQLATPASSVGSLEADVGLPNSKNRRGIISLLSTHSHFEDMNLPGASRLPTPTVNMQAAAGFVLLGIAAAAIFYNVKE